MSSTGFVLFAPYQIAATKGTPIEASLFKTRRTTVRILLKNHCRGPSRRSRRVCGIGRPVGLKAGGSEELRVRFGRSGERVDGGF